VLLPESVQVPVPDLVSVDELDVLDLTPENTPFPFPLSVKPIEEEHAPLMVSVPEVVAVMVDALPKVIVPE